MKLQLTPILYSKSMNSSKGQSLTWYTSEIFLDHDYTLAASLLTSLDSFYVRKVLKSILAPF